MSSCAKVLHRIKIQVGVGGFGELRRFVAAGADNFSSPAELLRAAAEARAAGSPRSGAHGLYFLARIAREYCGERPVWCGVYS